MDWSNPIDHRFYRRIEITMSKSIKGTQTEQNVLKSFAGESQARMRYEYFAKAATKEGFQQIAAIFQMTADQEKQHAKRFFRFLEGGDLTITAAYPAGVIGHTAENLLAAATGEHEEWTELYPAFAATAREEGFHEIAAAFTLISKAEKEHERRYRKLYDNLQTGVTFKRDGPVVWICRNCGFLHEGMTAPKKCPACQHPQAYFELRVDNF
eukprot:gnl/Dysnectes_brevis/398_a440_3770.p1 GENE.gnl/Dysnectes_brevis/398_a440_3770~~gnl/Dysnectes_brevis/398_a440_3770.p1  ORF type:complete len:211 (+),score=87.32 gnl/Dysnectes_brevis/398_a440_3770:471-1103(+)